MNDFRKLLDSFPVEQEEAPLTPEQLAQMSTPEPIVAPKATPVSQPEQSVPAQLLNNLPDISNLPAANRSPATETITKTSISGTLPQSDKADGSETAEARLERLMRELNDQRNKEREDAESRKFKADIAKAITDNIGTFVSGMQAKNTKAAVTPVQTKGYDVGDLVGQVDKKFAGDREALLDQYKQLLNARDRSEQRKFQQEQLEIQREGNDIKRMLAQKKSSNLANTLTPGEKAADSAFGKGVTDWESTGKAKVESNLKKLNEAYAELSSGKFKDSGRFQGMLPDAVQTNKAKAMRDLVRGTAQETLRATLGSQFTEKEGEAIMNRAYDPSLPPEENAKRAKAVIDELTQGYNAKNAQSKYFSEKGTLKGMGPTQNSQTAPSDIDSKIDSFMKKNGIVDRDEAIDILKKAGKI